MDVMPVAHCVSSSIRPSFPALLMTYSLKLIYIGSIWRCPLGQDDRIILWISWHYNWKLLLICMHPPQTPSTKISLLQQQLQDQLWSIGRDGQQLFPLPRALWLFWEVIDAMLTLNERLFHSFAVDVRLAKGEKRLFYQSYQTVLTWCFQDFNNSMLMLSGRKTTGRKTMWDVLVPWLRRWLSTGRSLVRLLL